MQPKNKPENLTPPNKGPAYVPKKEVTIYINELKTDIQMGSCTERSLHRAER